MRVPLETVKFVFLLHYHDNSSIVIVCIQVLSSVAAMVMTHPRLRAEFWNTVSTNNSSDRK